MDVDCWLFSPKHNPAATLEWINQSMGPVTKKKNQMSKIEFPNKIRTKCYIISKEQLRRKEAFRYYVPFCHKMLNQPNCIQHYRIIILTFFWHFVIWLITNAPNHTRYFCYSFSFACNKVRKKLIFLQGPVRFCQTRVV